MPTTTNFGWTTPTPDGSSGTWDDILNAAFDDVDADLQTVKDTADAALPAAGGTITGTTDSSSVSTGALIVNGGVGIAKKLNVGSALVVATGFGCNSKTAQTSVSLATPASDLNSAITLVNLIRGALIANGIATT